MKLFTVMAGILTLTLSINLYANTLESLRSMNEIESAQAILNQHAISCGNGGGGWWLKLDFNSVGDWYTGGISTANGQYTGCGTCGQCRATLNQRIDSLLAYDKSKCSERGGITKSENRGSWTEEIEPTKWKMSVSNVGIVCEKWIPCS
jgi:hypothetical protein